MVGSISRVRGREVFNKKGLPTLEVEVCLEDGSIGRATSPGGTSRGSSEAFYLSDGDRSYFDGMGVEKAIMIVNTEISAALKGKDAIYQEEVDRLLIELDGTENKSRLGGNTIVATSLANAKAAAQSRGVELFEHLGGGKELPTPLIHLMYGGPLYVGLAGICDFQEYALYALKADTYRDGFISSLDIFNELAGVVEEKRGFGQPRLAHLAGALVANFDSNDEALAMITEVIEECGYLPGKDFAIYLYIASTHLYKAGNYHLDADHAVLSKGEMIDRLQEMADTYPILSMEDCLLEDDWDGWRSLTERLGDKIQLVGDDLFTTNPARLQKGIERGVANAIVIKPNQVGTLTETIKTIEKAKSAGFGTIISSRSGQLWDPYLVHLCVARSLGQGKLVRCPVGGPSLNEIIRLQNLYGDELSQRSHVLPE